MLNLALRTVGAVVGVVAAAVMLTLNVLYSLSHTIARLAGFAPNQSHFFIGLLVTLIGLFGAIVAPLMPTISVALMVIATVAFFFVVGAWAIIPGVLFVIAIAIVFADRGRKRVRAA